MSRAEEFLREQRRLSEVRTEMLTYYRRNKIRGTGSPTLIKRVEETYPDDCCRIDIEIFIRRQLLSLREKLKRLF